MSPPEDEPSESRDPTALGMKRVYEVEPLLRNSHFPSGENILENRSRLEENNS
jgi:hypothetical protein